MTSFNTPEPISATVDVTAGEVRIRAGERETTTIDVQPSDPSNERDVKAASLTRVEYADRQLLVKAPKVRTWSIREGGGSLDVTIELPKGSDLHGTISLGSFDCDGTLGECRIKTALGNIRLDRAETVNLRSAAGDLDVGTAAAHAELTASSGDVRVRQLGSSAAIKNSNGDTWVGVAMGDLRVNAANGDIAIDAARASVVAKSSNGDVRLGDARGGTVVLESRMGDVEVGIHDGVAAYLDVTTTAGKVRNTLESSGAPDQDAETIEVRARTSVGDVVIRRPAG